MIMSLIEREALCESLYQEYTKLNTGSITDFYIQLGISISLTHTRLQPEQKHGKWIKLSDTWYGEHCMTTYACDQCGHDRQFIGPYMAAYCENCGAIMEER